VKDRSQKRSKPGKSQTVQIEGMAPLGWAVAGKGRDRLLVWGGVLGDSLRVGHFRQERGRTEAAIEAVLSRSAKVVTPPCAHFDVCGGCLWQHLAYETQLLMKREIVRSCFAGARLDTGSVLPVMGCDSPYAYRNKNDFTFGFGPGPALGFYESIIKISGGRSRPERGQVPPVFGVVSCPLQSELANLVLARVGAALADSGLSYYHPGRRRGLLRSLILRQSAHSGDVMIHFVAAKDCSDLLRPLAEDLVREEPLIKSVVLSVNGKRSKNAVPEEQVVLAGEEHLVEKVLGLAFRVSPTAFFQINTLQAENLYQIALDLAGVSAERFALDLYCGTGSLSLLLAQRFKTVVGIEVIDAAVADARENAHLNGIANCAFVSGDVAQILPQIIAGGCVADLVTVNPPRAGVAQSVIDEICRARPSAIVYVSCNPETLAGDLVHFLRGGYRIHTVQPVDMFPQTPHVEVVVGLEQKTR
jgi:23S rRNA (uracil1939-C5)-methyltransferase